jgi:hypothetical protein
MRDKFKKQLGSALLLSLLVMAGIITVSMGTSLLVMSEIKQSLYLDQSIIAFYAAEAGVESTLYKVRRENIDVNNLNNTTEELINDSNFNIYTSDSVSTLYTAIEQDKSYQVDIYSPGSLDLVESIKSIKIDWQGAGSWLEVNWACWSSSGILGEPKSQRYSVSAAPVTIGLWSASNCELYRVRLTARNANTTNINITAYQNLNGTGSVNIPARAQIKGLGEYPSGNNEASRQAILVTMPEKNPLSGLYDYVIYSEQPLVKENY